MLSLLPDWFEMHSFGIVASFSLISRFGHRLASIGGAANILGSLRECRPLLGGRHRGPDTMSVAQGQWSKATRRVEASYLKIA